MENHVYVSFANLFLQGTPESLAKVYMVHAVYGSLRRVDKKLFVVRRRSVAARERWCEKLSQYFVIALAKP